MPGAFERLAKSVLNRLGQDAFLVSGPTAVFTPCKANIEFGVQVEGPYSDGVFSRDIATLDISVGAKVGDILKHPKGDYVLDGVLTENGYTVRFTIRPAP